MSMIGNLLSVTEDELNRLYEAPESISDFIYESRRNDVIDLDKAWHVIHFMLTGSEDEGAPPLCHAIFGQKEIGEEDFGYGPALGTTSQMVLEISNALSSISEEEFCKMFNLKDIMNADIYPEFLSEDGILNDYILPSFRILKSFYLQAAADNNAVITFIS